MTEPKLKIAQALYDSLHARKAYTIIFFKRQEDVRSIQAGMDEAYERGRSDEQLVAHDLLHAAKGALFVLKIVHSHTMGTNEAGAIAHLEAAIAKAEGGAA